MNTKAEAIFKQVDFTKPCIIRSRKPHGISEGQLMPSSPFHRLAVYLTIIASSPGTQTLEDIRNAYNDVIQHLDQSHKSIKFGKGEAQNFNMTLDYLGYLFGGLIDIIKEGNGDLLKFIEYMALVYEEIYERAHFANKAMLRAFKNAQSDLSVTIPHLHLLNSNYQLAEMYARDALELLEDIPCTDLNDIKKRKFVLKLHLTMSYFGMGCSEVAFHTLKELKREFHGFYYAELKLFLKLLVDGYEKVMEYYHTKDNFKVISLGKDFEEFIESFEKGMTAECSRGDISQQYYNEFFKSHPNIGTVKTLLQKAKTTFIGQFQEAKNNSPECNILQKLDFDFKSYRVSLNFSDEIETSSIERALKKKLTFGKNFSGDTQKIWFIIDFEQCHINQIIKICEDITRIENAKKQQQAEKIQAKARLKNNQELDTQTSDLAITTTNLPINHTPNENSAITFFKPVSQKDPIDDPVKMPQKKVANRDKSRGRPRTVIPANPQAVENKNPVQVLTITWPTPGLTYYSDVANEQSTVKLLSGPSTPHPVYFGYIPAWILEDRSFNKELLHVLNRGNMRRDAIRNIIKELLTMDNQNKSKEHPYIFKIVIPNHNDRLIGWIEETYRQYRLICFGLMCDHKTKTLPDPQTLKPKPQALKEKRERPSDDSPSTSLRL